MRLLAIPFPILSDGYTLPFKVTGCSTSGVFPRRERPLPLPPCFSSLHKGYAIFVTLNESRPLPIQTIVKKVGS